MKKHFKILFFAAPVIILAAAFLVKVSSAVLLDIRISPIPESRTLARINGVDGSPTAGTDESQASRIACKGAGDILCTYQGGWKMCFENKSDYAAKEEVCGRYTITIGGQSAPMVSAEFSSLLEERSVCSNAAGNKSTCSGDYAGSFIACVGENDKICKRVDGPETRSIYYGCTQFESCTPLMDKYRTEEITNTVWAKVGAVGGDEKCRKAFATRDGGLNKTYASKQECESATASPSPSPSSSSSTMQACGMSGGYWRMSDSSCQSQSNCWDTGHADYNDMACQLIRRSMPPPSPSPDPKPEPKPDPKPDPNQCPRKPDPAKGTAEPTALPAEAEIKQVPSYYLWGCYSQPDKSAGECTAQATKRTGNITSPCVFSQESIVCPSKGTAYKEGDFLKCAPVKLPKNEEKKDERRSGGSNETTVITQTVERIVTVEVPSAASVTPPEVVTDESCKTYKEEVDEKVVSQGDAFLNAADAAFKSTAVNNPAFKKVFYDMLKESAKKSRKLQKLVSAKTCNAEAVSELHSTVKDFEAGELEKVKQTLAFLDKETKVQNQYVGINEDFKWVEKFAKSLKPGSAQATLFVEEMGTFEQMRIDFQDILNAEKEGKVFGFEVEAIAQQAKELRKSIEKKTSQISSEGKKETSVKKKSAVSKKTVKKKSTKKSTKKTDKKKSTKKSKQ